MRGRVRGCTAYESITSVAKPCSLGIKCSQQTAGKSQNERSLTAKLGKVRKGVQKILFAIFAVQVLTNL